MKYVKIIAFAALAAAIYAVLRPLVRALRRQA